MYDFWYALGVAAIKPTMLDQLGDADFTFLDRYIIEVNEKKQKLRKKAPSTGILINENTTKVREAIGKFVQGFSTSAPPIGIYCAGRFCQLMRIRQFNTPTERSSFREIITLANGGYVAAIDGKPESTLPKFPAFLGLCLVDGNMIMDFPAPTPKLTQILSEFGMKPDLATRDWTIATEFVKTDGFAKAKHLLMEGDNNPWQGDVTLEQSFFWDGFNEHAVS